MGGDKGFIQQFIEWIIHNGGLYFLLFVIFAGNGFVCWVLFARRFLIICSRYLHPGSGPGIFGFSWFLL